MALFSVTCGSANKKSGITKINSFSSGSSKIGFSNGGRRHTISGSGRRPENNHGLSSGGRMDSFSGSRPESNGGLTSGGRRDLYSGRRPESNGGLSSGGRRNTFYGSRPESNDGLSSGGRRNTFHGSRYEIKKSKFPEKPLNAWSKVKDIMLRKENSALSMEDGKGVSQNQAANDKENSCEYRSIILTLILYKV